MKPRIWPVVVWASLGIFILCALGTWQIFRLGEKEVLLGAIAARMQVPPISLSEAMKGWEHGDDMEFVVVETTGTFNHAEARRKLAVYEGNPGWEIITPFTNDEGIAVLVDRGTVADQPPDIGQDSEPRGPVRVVGVVRAHRSAQGYFDPENDVAGNRWYWWDVPAMLASVSIPGDVKVAPFILQALPQETEPGHPRAAPLDANLPNNHLQYAVTWFSFALILLVISGLFIRKLLKGRGA